MEKHGTCRLFINGSCHIRSTRHVSTIGVIPTFCTLICVCILSALCSLHMADTTSKYSGNLKFENEVEFSESFRYFWGHKWVCCDGNSILLLNHLFEYQLHFCCRAGASTAYSPRFWSRGLAIDIYYGRVFAVWRPVVASQSINYIRLFSANAAPRSDAACTAEQSQTGLWNLRLLV